MVDFNDLEDGAIAQMGDEFDVYMNFILDAAGPEAFSKWRATDNEPRRMSTFNAAVFDAVSVGLSEVFSIADIRENHERVEVALDGYRSLFSDEEFFAAVSGSVNDAAKVKLRINKMVDYLQR